MPIQYFIPDWDDRVDPHYDFLNDTHTPGRNPYHDDVYAHEIYVPPPYNGVLLSRTVLDESQSKYQAILDAGSVHKYLRLPDGHPVMGDCGAFSYWKEPEPPYQTQEMLDFYQRMQFNIGVSIDHLIFAELDAEKERRWDLTLANAEEFLRLYNQGNYTFTPMGVAQGWNPETYRQAVRRLIQMGYTHVALGGLVRSQNHEIIRVLQAVHEELNPNIHLHLFGVSRPEEVPKFMQLGVTSFDSASRLRKSWTDGRKNYYLNDTAYTAIRVRNAYTLAKIHGLDVAETVCKEQAALQALRTYDQDTGSFETAYAAVLNYAAVSGNVTPRMKADYQRTLMAQPWKHCPCKICQKIGIEVIIFRGNNRNRRRGFHNTWHLYQQLQSLSAHSMDVAWQQCMWESIMKEEQVMNE